jgi:tetratricopeptide (TPR) repeat protein
MSQLAKTELFVDKFIGREDLLRKVDEAIADTSKNHLFMFEGPGGMGKTALLRRISRLYEDQDDIVILSTDLSQAGTESFLSIIRNGISQMYRRRAFPQYDIRELEERFEERNNAAQMALVEGDEGEFQRLQQIAYDVVLDGFDGLFEKYDKRMLSLYDSFELAHENTIWGSSALSPRSFNIVQIYAGRPEGAALEAFDTTFPQIYGGAGWAIHREALERFDFDDVEEYFEMVLPVPLRRSLVETITVLTDGRPVLLAFTVEWFKHNVRLPDAINQSREALEALPSAELKQLRRAFEYELISRVRAVDEPLDRIILAMAYLDRRYNRRILRLSIDVSEDEAEKLESELRQMAFIRSFLDEGLGLLHDEAKRLINLYAWPPNDLEGRMRRALARKVIDEFYLPEIRRRRRAATDIIEEATSRLVEHHQFEEDLITHAMEMECLDYHARLGLDEARGYVTELIRDGVSLPKREGIRYEMGKVSAEEAEVAVARMNLDRGQVEGNREVIERVVGRGDLPPWYSMSLLYELSNALTDPEDRLDYLEQALNVGQANPDDPQVRRELPRVYNGFGLAYRRQGLWRKAEEAYETAIEMLKSVDNLGQRAATINNLAYVKLMKGETDDSEELADIALEIRKGRGNQFALAFSYLTKGQIAEVKGVRIQAMRDYRMAAELFEEFGREQDHALALIYLSEGKRNDGDFEAAERLLAPGLTLKPSEYRALAERELGALYRTHAKFLEGDEQADKYRQARAAFDRALEISRQVKDLHTQAQALLDLLVVGYLERREVDAVYADQLRELLERYDYTIIGALLDEIYAEVKYDSGDKIPALKQYLDILKLLCPCHTRKYETVFDRFRQKFRSLPAEGRDELCQYFDEVQETLPERMYASLKSLCRAMRVAY